MLSNIVEMCCNRYSCVTVYFLLSPQIYAVSKTTCKNSRGTWVENC